MNGTGKLMEVKETVDFLLEKAVHSDDIETLVSFRNIDSYYRLNAEISLDKDEREVVLNTLKAYPDVSIRTWMDEVSDEYEGGQ